MAEEDFYKGIKVKTMCITELAEMYEVSVPVFRRWLKPHKDKIGKRIGHYYTPKQVKIIFEILDYPDLEFNSN